MAGKQLYTMVACQEDGNHLAELKDQDWRDMGSIAAAWTRQFKVGMDAGDDLAWDQNGYIQIHPQF